MRDIMQIYERNRWLLKNENLTFRYLLGQEKLRLIKKWIIEMEEKSYQFWVKSMNLEELKEFYELYSHFISKKENAKVHNLIELYTDRIQNTDEIYFWYIRDETGNLLAWWIFVYKKDGELNKKVSITWFRAYNPDMFISKLYLWYYIEYFYYQRSIEDVKVEYLSRWRDRNAYGTLGTNIGLAIHKLQFKFLPFCSWNMVELEEKNINPETLVFLNPNSNWLYQKALLYTKLSEEEIEKKYWLIKKRGIELVIESIS